MRGLLLAFVLAALGLALTARGIAETDYSRQERICAPARGWELSTKLLPCGVLRVRQDGSATLWMQRRYGASYMRCEVPMQYAASAGACYLPNGLRHGQG